MTYILLSAIQLVGSLLLLLVAANVLLEFGKWALGCLLEAARVGGREALRASVAAYRATTRYLTDLLKRLTVRALKAIAKGAAALWRGTARRAFAWLAAHARAGWAGFGETDNEEGQAKQDDAPPRSPYEEALDLLGLADVQPLTREILKRRYAEIIRIVHPDKGFPNRAFAQQVNDAATTIKRRHNWR